MTHHMDLGTIVLAHGAHETRDDGVCLLEAVAWWAEEPHSDRPGCVCPTLAAFGRAWNDGMRSDDERTQLHPYVPALVGTAGSDEDAQRRAWLALDWLVRVQAPAWLDLAGLADHAARLRELPQVDGPDEAVLAELRSASRAATAARDATGAAAWAAAWAAARDAAWDAAWAAAGAAAWAAAGAAARAARDAAGAAAWDALEPAVTSLRGSAHDLYRQMIVAGPHDPDAVGRL